MLLCFVDFVVFDALSASRKRQDIKRLNTNAMVRRKNIDKGEHVIANEPTSVDEPRNARARESNRREKKVHRQARWCDANELFKQKQAPLCAQTRRRRRIAPVDALGRGDSGTGAKKQRTGETEPHERCRTSRRRWRRRRRRRFAVQRSGVPTSSREPENFRHLHDATRNRTPPSLFSRQNPNRIQLRRRGFFFLQKSKPSSAHVTRKPAGALRHNGFFAAHRKQRCPFTNTAPLSAS